VTLDIQIIILIHRCIIIAFILLFRFSPILVITLLIKRGSVCSKLDVNWVSVMAWAFNRRSHIKLLVDIILLGLLSRRNMILFVAFLFGYPVIIFCFIKKRCLPN